MLFTLPAKIARIAFWDKKAVYGLLFKASAETVRTMAADPKHLGARVGITHILHSWGSAMTHDPRVHMIVPGGDFNLEIANESAANLAPSFMSGCCQGSSVGCSTNS